MTRNDVLEEAAKVCDELARSGCIVVAERAYSIAAAQIRDLKDKPMTIDPLQSVQDAVLKAALNALDKQNGLIESIQEVIRSYMPGDGITQDQAIAEIIELTDGPEQRDLSNIVTQTEKQIIRAMKQVQA